MNPKLRNRRILILIIFITIGLASLIGRLAFLQFFHGEEYSKKARYNIVRTTLVSAPRGDIKDRKGRLIARDVPKINVCVDKSEIEESKEIDINIFSKTIAPIINLKTRDVIEKIQKSSEYEKIILKTTVDKPEMMRIAEIQKDLPGLYFEVQPTREYEFGENAGHVIGYVGEITEQELEARKKLGYRARDFIGKVGIEKQYDRELRGKYGKKQILVNAAGQLIKTILVANPEPGNTLYLSLDMELQKKVEDILKWHVDHLSNVSGERLAAAAVIIEIKSGEVLTMASYPGFDPNKFIGGISTKDYNALINRKDYPLLNRAIAGAYPAASTYKLITGAAALEENICTRYSPFSCPGFYKVGPQKFFCFVTTGHGTIDFHNAIAESCDVVFYYLGDKLGISRLNKYSRMFNIGKLTGIDIPGETKGLLPSPSWKLSQLKEEWYTGDTVNLSIGQGFLGVTPLQMALVAGAIANDGVMLKPHFLKAVEQHDKKKSRAIEPEILNRIPIKKVHFEAIRTGMNMAVTKGTAKRLTRKISAGAKTGTAESFASPENPNGRNHTWLVGYAPAHNPEIAFCVFFERSGGLAGERTVPIASEILNAYAAIYPDGP